MTCPDCDGERRHVDVPGAIAVHAPGDGPAVVVCTRCLRTWPPAEAPDAPPGEARAVSDALPADEGTAVAVVLAASLLSSVTGNKDALVALFEHVERSGADPRLALQRLAADPSLAPAVDVDRRLRQFEGLT